MNKKFYADADHDNFRNIVIWAKDRAEAIEKFEALLNRRWPNCAVKKCGSILRWDIVSSKAGALVDFVQADIDEAK
jgi:hypothetical protein